MYERFKDRAQFVAVYVREAHPTDGWCRRKDAINSKIVQPRTYGERAEVAQSCCSALKLSMPMVVDSMDDRVGHAYSGMPDRLYLINKWGKVAYKGGRGPFGFKPAEMEQALILLLLDENGRRAQAGQSAPPAGNIRNTPRKDEP